MPPEWVDLKVVSRIAYNNKLKREKYEQQKIEDIKRMRTQKQETPVPVQ